MEFSVRNDHALGSRRDGGGQAVDDANLTASGPVKPWRQGLARDVLYGRQDRGAEARARIALIMIAFVSVYTIIAGRLVSYASLR
jgi:hypothetical protein